MILFITVKNPKQKLHDLRVPFKKFEKITADEIRKNKENI